MVKVSKLKKKTVKELAIHKIGFLISYKIQKFAM